MQAAAKVEPVVGFATNLPIAAEELECAIWTKVVPDKLAAIAETKVVTQPVAELTTIKMVLNCFSQQQVAHSHSRFVVIIHLAFCRFHFVSTITW